MIYFVGHNFEMIWDLVFLKYKMKEELKFFNENIIKKKIITTEEITTINAQQHAKSGGYKR